MLMAVKFGSKSKNTKSNFPYIRYMKKHTVIETLDSFEDEFDAEKLIEKLLFIEQVEKGLKDVQDGRVLEYKDVKQKFADKWNK
jgi:hypothetical protein